MCRLAVKDGFIKVDCDGIDVVGICPLGKIPDALKNKGLYYLWTRIAPGLFDGMGGIHYEAVKIVCDIYDIPHGQRSVVMDMAIRLIEVYRNQDVETEEKGQLNDTSILKKS